MVSFLLLIFFLWTYLHNGLPLPLPLVDLDSIMRMVFSLRIINRLTFLWPLKRVLWQGLYLHQHIPLSLQISEVVIINYEKPNSRGEGTIVSGRLPNAVTRLKIAQFIEVPRFLSLSPPHTSSFGQGHPLGRCEEKADPHQMLVFWHFQ
jgi:hypothetical protein